MSNIFKAALEAGFSHVQAKFFEEHCAPIPHTHSIEEIEGLDEILEEIEEEEEGDE